MKQRPPARESGQAAFERIERVLDVACHIFARQGFEGTHVRQICRQAKVNIALVCYHFRGKRGLYQAVQARARQWVSSPAEWKLAVWALPPREALQCIVESLLVRLSCDSGWIARLLARELCDQPACFPTLAGVGLQGDLVLLEAICREALGPEPDADAVRLHALNVLVLCIFYSAAGKALSRIFPEQAPETLKTRALANLITEFALHGMGGARPPAEPRIEPCDQTLTVNA